MTDREIVAACIASRCCPLGAACGGKPQIPPVPTAARRLGISGYDAKSVANAWDNGAFETAILKAAAFGLRERIVRFCEGRRA